LGDSVFAGGDSDGKLYSTTFFGAAGLEMPNFGAGGAFFGAGAAAFFGTGAAFYNFVTQTIYILFTRRTDLARFSKEMDTNVVIMFTSHIHSECL